ncbi:MAG: T9SS type A sorting domain-containing protein, partial [Fimbriimonadaceae bacterium]|nr:T9SS type A sorting domain-containing protein [Chitinophagales bacterium]
SDFLITCFAPGYVSNSDDCDDTNSAKHTGATDICDDIDNDCDGATDEDATFITYYADADGDGYGSINSIQSTCDGVPVGYVANDADCNDANNTVYLGAVEVCDGMDNDCDGLIDEGIATATITASGSTSICNGSTVILNANTGTGFTYKWKRNGANISGATNVSYSASAAGNYTVVVTVPGGCQAVSVATTVTLLPSPTATITTPDGLDLCGRTKVRLQANSGSGYTYQWYKNALLISGATTRTYQATTTGSYQVVVTRSNGCSRTSASKTVVKACRESELSEDIQYDGKLELYPNPTSDILNVKLQLSDNILDEAIIIIYNMVGEIIYSAPATIIDGVMIENIIFDNSITSGLYIMNIMASEKQFTKQFIINK